MFDYKAYLRMNKLPHIWCPGCGNGIVLKGLLRAIDSLKLDKNKTVVVSGIGCSSRASGYMDFNTLHTTHGRAITFATGIKMAKPELKVIVISGDGDATAIGGNHFIHACRRNIDLTLILFNNSIYGMTGGQYSPSTPLGMMATTAPYGQIDPPFDISGLAVAAGASFVARTTTFHLLQMEKFMARGLTKQGFALIEVLTGCPVIFGRKNRMGDPSVLIRWQKEKSVSVEQAKGLSEEDLMGKFVVGVLADKTTPEYTAEYAKLIERARNS